MGIIIITIFVSILSAFFVGIMFAKIYDSDNNEHPFFNIFVICLIILSIGITINVVREYIKNKEYSSTEYSLKKKVITIDEDNTIKVDTVYTFIHK